MPGLLVFASLDPLRTAETARDRRSGSRRPAAARLLLAGVGFVLGALCPTAAQAGQRYAVLVGINDYTQPEITDLRFAVQDVTALAETLTKTPALGFAASNVFVLTDQAKDDSYQPRQSNILVRLEQMQKQAQPDDLFLFFFAGHGLEAEGQYYLLTRDSDVRGKTALERSSLRLSDVRDLLTAIPASSRLLFFDACREDVRSGARASGGQNGLSEVLVRGMRPRVTEEGPVAAPRLTATIYATQQGQRSFEWPAQRHGFFSYYVNLGLRGEAAQTDGRVTLDSLEAYLAQAVPAATRREIDQLQMPWVDRSGPSGSGLVLAVYPPRTLEAVVATARLKVASNPSGAPVLIDNQMVGTTPCDAEVDLAGQPERTVEVTVTRQGYRTETRRLRLSRGQVAEIDVGEMVKRPLRQAVTGGITIESDPPGAVVVLDGVEVGRTPYTDPYIAAGTHRIALLMAGKSLVEQEAAVAPGKTASLKIKLEAQPATLIIDTSPPGATATVNGEKRGETPLTVSNLKPGEHEVELTLKGFDTQKTTVGLTPGAVVPMKAVLVSSAVGDALADPAFDQRVTVKAIDEGVQSVLARVAATTGLSLAVDPAVEARRVTITLADVPVRSVMRVLNAVYGLQVVRRGEVYTVVPKEADYSGGAIVRQGTAELIVQSVPERAAVFVNGQHVGTTPLRYVVPVVAGEARQVQVDVRADGRGNYRAWALLSSGRVAHLGVLVLPPSDHLDLMQSSGDRIAELIVTSAPAGADVRLDDAPVGVTPLRLSIPMYPVERREAEVRIVKKGHRQSVSRVHLVAGRTTAVGEMLLVPLTPVKLAIESKPSGAEVAINGVVVGTTPYTGEHPVNDDSGLVAIRMEVRKEGHLPTERTERAESGGSVTWQAELRPGVRVGVNTEAGNAAWVNVNGIRVGRTPWEGTVQAPERTTVSIECESLVGGAKARTTVALASEATVVLAALVPDRTGILQRGWKPPAGVAWDVARDGGPMVYVPPSPIGQHKEPSLPPSAAGPNVPAGRSDTASASDGYWVHVTKVTVAQYVTFLAEIGSALRHPGAASSPVGRVSFNEAAEYCGRYGLALPTEAQWLSMARMPAGSVRVADVDGWEWCRDWHDINQRVIRGRGPWFVYGDTSRYVRTRTGCRPGSRADALGFRCVWAD